MRQHLLGGLLVLHRGLLHRHLRLVDHRQAAHVLQARGAGAAGQFDVRHGLLGLAQGLFGAVVDPGGDAVAGVGVGGGELLHAVQVFHQELAAEVAGIEVAWHLPGAGRRVAARLALGPLLQAAGGVFQGAAGAFEVLELLAGLLLLDDLPQQLPRRLHVAGAQILQHRLELRHRPAAGLLLQALQALLGCRHPVARRRFVLQEPQHVLQLLLEALARRQRIAHRQLPHTTHQGALAQFLAQAPQVIRQGGDTVREGILRRLLVLQVLAEVLQLARQDEAAVQVILPGQPLQLVAPLFQALALAHRLAADVRVAQGVERPCRRLDPVQGESGEQQGRDGPQPPGQMQRHHLARLNARRQPAGLVHQGGVEGVIGVLFAVFVGGAEAFAAAQGAVRGGQDVERRAASGPTEAEDDAEGSEGEHGIDDGQWDRPHAGGDEGRRQAGGGEAGEGGVQGAAHPPQIPVAPLQPRHGLLKGARPIHRFQPLPRCRCGEPTGVAASAYAGRRL